MITSRMWHANDLNNLVVSFLLSIGLRGSLQSTGTVPACAAQRPVLCTCASVRQHLVCSMAVHYGKKGP